MRVWPLVFLALSGCASFSAPEDDFLRSNAIQFSQGLKELGNEGQEVKGCLSSIQIFLDAHPRVRTQKLERGILYMSAGSEYLNLGFASISFNSERIDIQTGSSEGTDYSATRLIDSRTAGAIKGFEEAQADPSRNMRKVLEHDSCVYVLSFDGHTSQSYIAMNNEIASGKAQAKTMQMIIAADVLLDAVMPNND